jgi:plasmid maintenance system antidote protein VapI
MTSSLTRLLAVRFFGSVTARSLESWLSAQMAVDLWHAQQEVKDERRTRRKSA